MSRRGRSRKNAPRTSSGQIARRADPRPWTPETMAHRAKIVGEQNAMDSRAGEALGQAFYAGILGVGERALDRYAAGETYRALHRRWAQMASICPRELTQPRSVSGVEPDPERWANVSKRMREAGEAIKSAGHLAETAIDTLLVDNVLPGILLASGKERAMKTFSPAICAGLDALAAHFKISKREVA